MLRTYHIYLAIVLILFASCSSYERDHHSVVRKWLDKEIYMPESLRYQIKDIPINYDFEDADFKIVTYLDSTGCSSCRMKLSEWNDIINEFKSIPDISVNFVMVFNTKKPNDVVRKLKVNNFSHPIVFDDNNRFAELNLLPTDIMCHTFLLDGDNKIIGIGNPAYNPKVRKLYANIISKDIPLQKHGDDIYTVCCSSSVPLGVMKISDTINVKLDLQNNDSIPLYIEGIVPSCDCIGASIQTDVLMPGQSSVMTVSIIPKPPSGIFCQTLSLFFEEKNNPETITVHGYIK